jgi:hypothetical protein
MQNMRGHTPQAFCAMEYQEWMRCRAIPAMDAVAASEFRMYANSWFGAQELAFYRRLQKACDHPSHRKRPCALIAADQAPTHCWVDVDHYIEFKTKRDRRDIPALQRGHIALDKERDFMPTAPKVPDTLQQPIEMIFATVKREVRKRLAARPGAVTWQHIWEDIQAVWREKVNAALCESCFDHALKAIKIWSTPVARRSTLSAKQSMKQCTALEGVGCLKRTEGRCIAGVVGRAISSVHIRACRHPDRRSRKNVQF